jgi:hypothetical protein
MKKVILIAMTVITLSIATSTAASAQTPSRDGGGAEPNCPPSICGLALAGNNAQTQVRDGGGAEPNCPPSICGLAFSGK